MFIRRADSRRSQCAGRAMESPATALRRHRTEVRRLLLGGFTKYALMKTAHAQWRDTGRGTPRGFLTAASDASPLVRGLRSLIMCSRPSLPPRADPPPLACLREDVLTSVANAALLRDEACSHPLPRRVAAIPELESRLILKRRAVLVAAARRAADLNDPDESNGSSESASLVVLLDALAEARAVADELEAVLEKANRAARATDREPRRSFSETERAHATDPDEPPFECLSAPDLLARLRTTLDAYASDVRVKRTALGAVAAGAEVFLRERNQRKRRDGGGDGGDGDGFDMSRETMTTCVATWILSPSIDDAAREEFDAIIAQETK